MQTSLSALRFRGLPPWEPLRRGAVQVGTMPLLSPCQPATQASPSPAHLVLLALLALADLGAHEAALLRGQRTAARQ